jgi:hypothetical protein
VRTVGRRTKAESALADQGRLARTAALLRGGPGLVPRGVYRFTSFEEADAWMTRMMARTHARAGRFTRDIDLLVDDSPENVGRVKQGLGVLFERESG